MARPSRRRVDGILLLDKPAGLTSNAALQRVKRCFDADKAGHTGSLDPLATGVLPICLGGATRVSAFLLEADKCYRARARLGLRTSTGDSTGEAVVQSDWRQVHRELLEAAAEGLRGAQLQVPPMYSALKRDGQPLYRLARQGREVEREARPIEIHALALTAFEPPEFEFTVSCSKGTYVRTLAEDWALRCGQQAHLVALRRTRIGGLDEAGAVTLERLEALAGPEACDAHLLDAGIAVAGWARLTVDADAAARLAQGRILVPDEALAPGRLAVFTRAGTLLALAEVRADGSVQPRAWLGRGGPCDGA